MTGFRKRYAAHREFTFTDPVPNFDPALAVAYYYDIWVRGIISPHTLAEPTLESSALLAKVGSSLRRKASQGD